MPKTFGRFVGIATAMILVACASGSGTPDKVSGHAPGREPLQLTYIANEGVVVSSGASKILIDALFDKPNPEYRAPSPEVLEKIMKGEAPYDGVDLALVTHNHPDHFDASLAARYLVASPGTVFVGPADAVAAMRAAANDWATIEPRVVSLDIKIGEKSTKELKGISLTALRTKHSGEQESPMNLMYLFDLDGWRVFHEGDSTGKAGVCSDSALGGVTVDLALVHFWFPLDPDCARFLQEGLKPSHIALMHLPIRLESDAPGKIDQVRKYYGDLFLMLPGMRERVFTKVVRPGASAVQTRAS
jgi:L-ascorbate metabolism protein UlaG (beta-lactamase superfamily)